MHYKASVILSIFIFKIYALELKHLIKILLLFITVSTVQSQLLPLKNYTVKDGLPSSNINDIVQDKEGYIWLGTDAGIVKFDGYNLITYTVNDGLSDNIVRCLNIDKEGKIWLGTESGGITVIDKNDKFVIDNEQGLISKPISFLFCDNYGNTWACGWDGGISIIGTDTVITLDEENSLLQSEVFCYYVDMKGLV